MKNPTALVRATNGNHAKKWCTLIWRILRRFGVKGSRHSETLSAKKRYTAIVACV